jgi:flagellar basal body-associated protein FliL
VTPFLLVLAASVNPAILLLCCAMTLGLLFYTFYFQDGPAEAREKSRVAFLRERKDAVYENLRDLNFEYKAGKFPDHDYQQMRVALEDEAAALLAEIESLSKGIK